VKKKKYAWKKGKDNASKKDKGGSGGEGPGLITTKLGKEKNDLKKHNEGGGKKK